MSCTFPRKAPLPLAGQKVKHFSKIVNPRKVTKWVTLLYGYQKTPYLLVFCGFNVFLHMEHFFVFFLNECAICSINGKTELS